jgi:hypothetical protein
MLTQYVQATPVVSHGDVKPVMLIGTSGPTSYSQTTRDPVSSPATGDYIYFPMEAVTLSKNYVVRFYPSATGQLRAGAVNTPGQASTPGWTAMWFNNTTTAGTVGNEVTAGTNLSAEILQFGAFVGQI